MAKALIYSYYETGIPIENEYKTKFKCLTCMTIGEKTKPDPKGNNGGQDVYVTITGTTSSNLITHLEKDSHNKQYKEYMLFMHMGINMFHTDYIISEFAIIKYASESSTDIDSLKI